MKEWIRNNSLSIIITVGLIIMFSWAGINIMYPPPPSPEQLIYEEVRTKTANQLVDPELTCEILTEMRLESERNGYPNDPLWNDYLKDKARQMWNIMGCGNHWSWWD